MIKKMFLTVCLFSGLFVFLCAGPAQSLEITFNLVDVISSDTPVGSLTAIFNDDTDDPKTVKLTMKAENLDTDEFIHAWYFNFDPTLTLTDLTVSYVSGFATGINGFDTGEDAFNVGDGGRYDIVFDFSSSSGDRFLTGESNYIIKYSSAINAGSFDYLSAAQGGHDLYLSAAHVGGTTGDEGSGWVGDSNGAPVPEPATLFLFGVGLLGLGGAGRKKFKK